MFLELSFNSQVGDKEVSASKAASSWRYDREDKQELSLDELISDFQQSATSRRSKREESVSGSDASPLRLVSPPRRAKAKESDKRSWGFADRARVAKREPSQKKPVRGASRKVQHNDSSDDDGGAVTPMPRLEHILKNKPSFALKRRAAAASTVSTCSKLATVQRSQLRARTPPSLSPQSLSPLTSSSLASSPLSVSEDIYTPETPEEDSIDALIGKDIRELNQLVSTGSRQTRAIGAARSPTTDEMSSVLRQSTRFGKVEAKNSRFPLRLQLPSRKARSAMPESPPPPPPPEDEDEDFEEDEEEDSFAQEIRQLRESRRLPPKAPEKETPLQEPELESSAVCATAALKIRNASNAINELLLAALKPFEDRQREEEKTKTLEEEDAPGDAVIRKAATAELQSATHTIVSQLDLTFADMTERRKADLKVEEDAAAATKIAEKKEKEAVETTKKTDEKEAKDREREILRLIPMQGKLLTCSADIEKVLTQLERTDTKAQRKPVDGESAMEAEIAALRRHTQRKIHEMEAQMSAAPPKHDKSDRFDGISWRAVDWVQDNMETDPSSPQDRANDQLSATNDSVETNAEAADDDEGAYQEILQRQVLEKLDLTMLKLKHVLSIDTKEAAEAQEKQQREEEEHKTKQAQQELEVERKEQEQEDAKNARRRVMGVTSIHEVEGWIEEGRQLQDELGHDRSLNRLIASLDDNMNAESAKSPCWRAVPPNQEEAFRHFDRLVTAMTAHQQPQLVNDKAIHEHGDCNPDDVYAYWHARNPRTLRAQQMQTSKRQSWGELSGSSSDSEDEGVSTIDRIIQRGRNQDTPRRRNRSYQSLPPSPLPSPPRHTRHVSSSSGKQRRKHVGDEESDYKTRHDVPSPSESKQRRRRRKLGGSQQEIARTIHALQAERRQKTWWIQNHLRSPSGGRRPI